MGFSALHRWGNYVASDNSGFFKVPNEAFDRVLKLYDVHALAVYLALCRKMQGSKEWQAKPDWLVPIGCTWATVRHISTFTGLTTRCVQSKLKLLEELGFIKPIRTNQRWGTIYEIERATRGHANNLSVLPGDTLKSFERATRGHDPIRIKDPDLSEFDFEGLYALYPRKSGKAKGLKLCVAQIKTQEDFTKLERAIKNYANECRELKTEKRFIKLFSTFMNKDVWPDYAETEDPNQIVAPFNIFGVLK